VIVGVAALHRPFDAALAVIPVVVYLVWTRRSSAVLQRGALLVVAGAAPFVLALLAYNAAVMGSPFRLPYGVTGPHDTFFFGWRSSSLPPGTGHAIEIHYTLGRAFSTLGHDLALLPRFVALAPLVLLFAGAAVWKHRADPRSWLLVGMVVTVVGAYFFWWATANAELFRIDRGLGPFYDYAALAPLCVLGAWGLATVKVPTRALIALGTIALLWSLGASWNVLGRAREQGRARSVAVRETEPPSSKPTLVMLPPEYRGDPFLRYASDYRLDHRRLAALDVPGQRLALVNRFPDRASFLVRGIRPFGDVFGHTVRDRVPLTLVRGRQVRFTARGKPPGRGVASAYLRVGEHPPVFEGGDPGGAHAAWTIDAASLDPSRTTTIAVGLTVGAPGLAAPQALTAQRYECRFDARVVRGVVEVLSPCDGWNHYEFPNGRITDSNEDVSSVLVATVRSTARSPSRTLVYGG
jgi:hypothetical protein